MMTDKLEKAIATLDDLGISRADAAALAYSLGYNEGYAQAMSDRSLSETGTTISFTPLPRSKAL